MTTRNDEHGERGLESMYREHGDAGPSEGLDRIIRARAEHAARESAERKPRRRIAPWVGGLATASVAIVAIAVVLRQSPPAGDLAGPDRAEPGAEAVQAPAAEAPPASSAPPVGRAARLATEPDTAGLAPAQGESAAGDSLRARRPAADDPAELLAAIRARLDDGDTEAARALLTALRSRHPGTAVPEDIAAAMDEAAAPE